MSETNLAKLIYRVAKMLVTLLEQEFKIGKEKQ